MDREKSSLFVNFGRGRAASFGKSLLALWNPEKNRIPVP
jgi:hypothetical protein